jgi:hypothetical protein
MTPGGSAPSVTDRTDELAVAGRTIQMIASFGEDAAGELYLADQTGEIYKIVPRCPANCDGSTAAPVLNISDFTCFLSKFAANDCYNNCDGSNQPPILNVNDFVCFIGEFAQGCP